jgi:type II secretory pathway pseudopilin PulG
MRGFTLVETLIVLGGIAVIATIGTISFINYRDHQDLDLAVKAAVAALRDVQQRAISQQEGLQWGIHFENVLVGRDFYATFKGSSYSTSSAESFVYLKSNLKFYNPPSNNAKDIIFSKVTGYPNVRHPVTFVLSRNESVCRTISFNPRTGLIVYTDECPLTNINSTAYNYYAWNDTIGWIDFLNAAIYPDRMEGYAINSFVGDIFLNCNNTPNGDICAGPAGDWKVTNDGDGNLSGWAWNDSIGWISFNCNNPNNNCGVSNYAVTVSPVTGEFSGWAWNDSIGWISFNCANAQPGFPNGTCAAVDYKVKTP